MITNYCLVFLFAYHSLNTVLFLTDFKSSRGVFFKVREKLCGKELGDSRMQKGPGYSARVTHSFSTSSITANTRGLKGVPFCPWENV